MKKSLTQILLYIGLCSAIHAQAYNEGGHYYTLLALFDSEAKMASENQLREMKLQAVCTELPDMSSELEAITQRVRVLKSFKDYLWGLNGRCQTTISSHMVASQYYLHGLSGTPADRMRMAAHEVIKSIDDDLAKLGAKPSQERRNLICARGFAAHLYGDSFAHVKLSSENPGLVFRIIRSGKTEMYDTGLAHVRDGHEPDYLYGHKIDIDRWPQWVHDAASNIAFGSDPAPALNLHQPCQGKIATCEEPARLQLEYLLTMKDQLMVPGLQTLITTGKSGLGGLERSTKCDDLVNSALPNANERPQCDISWKTYLAKAIPVFYKFGIDPTSQPDATAGKNCSAWRCTGNETYDGQLPGSCKFEIIDDLRFGLEPLP